MLDSFIVQLVAILLLSLGMHKHFKTIFNRALPYQLARLLKGSGWLLLTGSYWLAVLAGPAPLMSVYWSCYLMITILFTGLLMSYRR